MYDPDEAKGTDASAPAQRLAGAVWATLLRRGQIGLSPSEPRRKPNEHDDFNVHFFGLNGQRLGTYGARENTNFTERSTSVYFAGKLIREGNTAVNEDRLGSAVKHFPYGEEPTTTDHDRVKFATYYRDATTTLDYADQRYYLRTIGRFLTADPYRASAGPAGPQFWNRYAYVQGDPVNFNDPTGAVAVLVSSHDEGVPTSWYPFGYFAAYYSLPHPGDPGPGGDPTKSIKPWQLGWEARTFSWRNATFWAIHGLSEKCKRELSDSDAHVDIDALAAASQTITFWEAGQYEGRFTQGQLFGNGGTIPLREGPLNRVAFVVTDSQGKITPNVVLRPDFLGPVRYPTSWDFRNAVLVHEALHVYTKLFDDQLPAKLGIRVTDQNLTDSERITLWLQQDCPESVKP